jgi:predicted HicB family RNase H-like nuclease
MLHIKIGDDLKKQLETEATEKGLSLNAYIRMLLIERKQ